LFLIDAHCHVNSDQLRADALNVVRRAGEAGVMRLLTVGTDLTTSAEAVEMTRSLAFEGRVYATVGVHPHDAKSVAEGLPESLLKSASEPRVVAIGETGLDYHYNHSPHDVQKKIFRLHVDWAVRAGKPLVIHVRGGQSHNAMSDALEILGNTPPKIPLMFHCYAGGIEYLDAMRELDAYLSFGGPVTWPKNGGLRQTVARVPEDRLLCETDAPWLTPSPYRGKLNEPAHVRLVYEEIAKVRGIPTERLALAVDANAARLFGWSSLYTESLLV
jgi:TatD DNase family protein